MMTRRSFLSTTACAVPAAFAASCVSPATDKPVVLAEAGQKIGITDWNLGDLCDPEQIPLAASLGLNGIQVSVGTDPDNMPLRESAVRERYLELGKQHGVSFPSVAAGRILNMIPLKSEPESAVYVIDALEAAKALGSSCILAAFFGGADLRERDEEGGFTNLSDGPFAEYKLDDVGVDRVVAAMKQIVPRAEELGVIIGLEDTLTAKQNLEIIDRVGSDMLQVYYDVGNSTGYGYDIGTEIRALGVNNICEIHLKETLGLNDPMRPIFGGPESGGVDFEAAVAAVTDIGFEKWFIFETSGRDGHFEEDTRRNVEFATSAFYG